MPQPLPVVEGEPTKEDPVPAVVIPLSRAEDPERGLLERHVSGERDAFAQLMKNLSNPVYGYLTRCGIPPGERDDLFQDVFCKVHQGAHRKMPEGPVLRWVLRITVNTVRDHHRRTKVRSVVKLDAEAGAEVSASSTSPDEAMAAKETATFLEAQIARLPLPQREALLLSSVGGLGVKGAAEVLGESPDTVKTRLRRARLALAESMQRRAAKADREESR